MELDFELGGHRYLVVRGLNSAELYLDGATAPIATSISAVTELLRRIEDIVEKVANQEFRVRMNMQALNDAMLDQLERLFEGTPGMTQVIFELVSADGTVATVASQQRVKLTPELVEAVRRLKGEQAAA